MEWKKYKNKRLQQIIKKQITFKKYGDFAIVFQEILQRRAYEFGFSDLHMESEIQHFADWMIDCKFVDATELPFPESAAMYMIEGKEAKKILINRDIFTKIEHENPDEIYVKLYEVLTHEVYHAIGMRGDGATGLKYQYGNQRNGKDYAGTALNETFNEAAASRASFSKTMKDFKNYRAKTIAFPELTFVPNLLAASLGVSEKEILKAGIVAGEVSRQELGRLFREKFQNQEILCEAYEIFQEFEVNLGILFNNLYKARTSSQDFNKNYIKKLYSSIYELASLQIANDTREITFNYIAELFYRYSKMDKIRQDSLGDFIIYGSIKSQDKEEILKNGMAHTNILYEQIKERYISAMQSYSIQDKNFKSDYEKYIFKEDYDNGKQWDNKPIEKVLKRIFEKDKRVQIQKGMEITAELPEINTNSPISQSSFSEEENSFFTPLKKAVENIIRRIQNRNQKKLPLPPEESQQRQDRAEYYTNLVNNPWKVSKERLISREKKERENVQGQHSVEEHDEWNV